MIRNYTYTLILLLIFVSCGKSKEEIQLEKTKIELEKTKLELIEKTKKEEENKINEQKAELKRIHDQRVNVGKRKKINELMLILQKLPQNIEKAQQNITSINEFQFGRLASTKEQQLKEARNQLMDLLNYEEKVKNEIAQLEYFKTFDFQKDPESVMKYIFSSARKGDFSDFRNLCDPYGENDSDVNQICFAEMFMENQKKDLIREFKNGRVIGKALINGDVAEVEFAFGESSNHLEKMTMVKRNGLWYLASF